MTSEPDSPVDQERTARAWERANRELLAKAVTELTYEEVIDAVDADGALHWELPTGVVTGRAVRRALGWWRVDPDSLGWTDPGGAEGALPDATQVLAAALQASGVGAPVVANLVAELSSTLVSDVRFHEAAVPAADLVDREPVDVESALRGHPWIIANKGRVGFDVDDLRAYAPEFGQDVRLLWLAADPAVAQATAVTGLHHHAVVREQVGDEWFGVLRERASRRGLDPDTCIFVPVHPWQWRHRVVLLHAAELARGTLVPLGEAPRRYRPQLAIRTMTDADDPCRRYVKLPLSILNTSVYRGLPRERTLAAPALTAWLSELVAADPVLSESGMILLGEVAGVSVAHRTYESLDGVPYQHTEMLGAIWREPVQPFLDEGERAVSLAALLHVDPQGRSVVEELVARSGLSVPEWTRRLHAAVLTPLFQVLYRYGAMFSPHGQNCMIVHRDGTPTRIVVKDFVDDLAICSDALPEHSSLAPEARVALRDVTLPAGELIKYLQNGLLVCVYRYLAEVMSEHLGLPETDFWAAARATLDDYQAEHADLADRFAMFDLRAETFPKLCLNRLRLFERGYADDAERPVIKATGSVANPLSPAFGP